jgi:hypothetical protein
VHICLQGGIVYSNKVVLVSSAHSKDFVIILFLDYHSISFLLQELKILWSQLAIALFFSYLRIKLRLDVEDSIISRYLKKHDSKMEKLMISMTSDIISACNMFLIIYPL